MVVIKKIFHFVEELWSDYRFSRDIAKTQERAEQALIAALQKKKGQPSLEVPQASTSLPNKIKEEQPNDANASPCQDFTQKVVVPTTVLEPEILDEEDGFKNCDTNESDEYHNLLRMQIEAGRENVLNMIGKIRSFNGAAVPLSKVGEAYGEFGPQGFLQRLEEARARAQERAVSRIKMEKKL